jgi:hypothetical protein
MNGIECFNRDFEPAAVQPVHPVMGQDECSCPDQKYYIIDDSAKKKNVFDFIHGHDKPPWHLQEIAYFTVLSGDIESTKEELLRSPEAGLSY